MIIKEKKNIRKDDPDRTNDLPLLKLGDNNFICKEVKGTWSLY